MKFSSYRSSTLFLAVKSDEDGHDEVTRSPPPTYNQVALEFVDASRVQSTDDTAESTPGSTHVSKLSPAPDAAVGPDPATLSGRDSAITSGATDGPVNSSSNISVFSDKIPVSNGLIAVPESAITPEDAIDTTKSTTVDDPSAPSPDAAATVDSASDSTAATVQRST